MALRLRDVDAALECARALAAAMVSSLSMNGWGSCVDGGSMALRKSMKLSCLGAAERDEGAWDPLDGRAVS